MRKIETFSVFLSRLWFCRILQIQGGIFFRIYFFTWLLINLKVTILCRNKILTHLKIKFKKTAVYFTENQIQGRIQEFVQGGMNFFFLWGGGLTQAQRIRWGSISPWKP